MVKTFVAKNQKLKSYRKLQAHVCLWRFFGRRSSSSISAHLGEGDVCRCCCWIGCRALRFEPRWRSKRGQTLSPARQRQRPTPKNVHLLILLKSLWCWKINLCFATSLNFKRWKFFVNLTFQFWNIWRRLFEIRNSILCVQLYCWNSKLKLKMFQLMSREQEFFLQTFKMKCFKSFISRMFARELWTNLDLKLLSGVRLGPL